MHHQGLLPTGRTLPTPMHFLPQVGRPLRQARRTLIRRSQRPRTRAPRRHRRLPRKKAGTREIWVAARRGRVSEVRANPIRPTRTQVSGGPHARTRPGAFRTSPPGSPPQARRQARPHKSPVSCGREAGSEGLRRRRRPRRRIAALGRLKRRRYRAQEASECRFCRSSGSIVGKTALEVSIYLP